MDIRRAARHLGIACVALSVAAAPAPVPPPAFVASTVLLENQPGELRAGRLDADPFPDLALVTAAPDLAYSRRLVLLAGDGKGRFDPANTWVFSTYAYSDESTNDIEIADVNRDGWQDVVIGEAPQAVVVHLGDGTMSLADPLKSALIPSGFTQDISLVDLNGDGILDAVTYVYDWGGYIDYGLGRGDGYFCCQKVICCPGSADAQPVDIPTEIVTGDVDEDGHVDAIWGNRFGLHMRRGKKLGIIDPLPYPSVIDTVAVRDLALVDLDHDDHLDLLYTLPLEDRLGVRLGTGDGGFGPEWSEATAPQPEQLHLTDLDRDGELDVITGHGVGSRVTIRYGSGKGTFPRGLTVQVGLRPYAVTSADFDNDGDVDLAVSNAGETSLSILLNQLVP